MGALHQVDQTEVARAEHDCLLRGGLGLLEVGGLVAAAGCLVHRALDAGGVLVAGVQRAHGAVREGSLHQLGQRVSVALPERGPLGLPVVG